MDKVRELEPAIDLEGRLRFEAAAMRAAMEAEDTPGSFHLANWKDKPHRVVFDACRLMEEAADALSHPHPSADKARELLASELETNHQLVELAGKVRDGSYEFHSDSDSWIAGFAVRAIEKALSRPQPSDDEMVERLKQLDVARFAKVEPKKP